MRKWRENKNFLFPLRFFVQMRQFDFNACLFPIFCFSIFSGLPILLSSILGLGFCLVNKNSLLCQDVFSYVFFVEQFAITHFAALIFSRLVK